MTDPEHAVSDESSEEPDDAEDLPDAYEALEQDRRQRARLTSTDPGTVPDPPADVVTEERTEPEPPPDAAVTLVETPDDQRVASEPARRVFLIEGKEYPDPDASLPITVLARFSRCTATTSPVSSTTQTSSRRLVRTEPSR